MEPDVKYTLKMLRAKENLSQKQVADALGVSLTTYNAWEKDISNVAVSKVAAVADFYGVTLGQISFCPVHENNSCKTDEGDETTWQHQERRSASRSWPNPSAFRRP